MKLNVSLLYQLEYTSEVKTVNTLNAIAFESESTDVLVCWYNPQRGHVC